MLFFALLAMLHDGNPGVTAAAGILGVISGISATRGAGYSIGQLIANAVPVHGLLAFLAHQPRPHRDPTVLTPIHELQVLHLTHQYPGSERAALSDVSLTVGAGEAVAFVGRNGAGKTTCVHSILGIVTPESGTIVLNDMELATMDPDTRNAQFGLLTQEFGRYELTIRQTLLLGTSALDCDDERLWAALEAAGAAGFVRETSAQLETQLGAQWGGVGLSGGQWQRLSLARMYLRNSPIWVLDEPTSAIDSASEAAIFDTLVATKHDRITIVVSHRASTLRKMDRIYVFADGDVVEVGTYAELLARNGEFVALFREELEPLGTESSP